LHLDLPEEAFGFDKWKEVAQHFVDMEQERPDQVKVVQFAHLNADPKGVVADLFRFCGLIFGVPTVDFIEQSRSKEGSDANSIYRNVRDDVAWKERLPKHIADTTLAEVGAGPLSRFLV